MADNDRIFFVRHPYSKDKPVLVYKNLHNGLWSVRQDGKVVIHCNRLCLRDVSYRVQPAGRDKVRREGRKNVHAFVHGYICGAATVREGTRHNSDDELNYCNVYYNPYTCDAFMNQTTNEPIHKSDFCDLDVDDLYPVLAIFISPNIEGLK